MSVRHNINIVAGEPISRVITYKDPDEVAINLTGYTAAMHLKRNLDDAHNNTHTTEVIPIPRMFANTARTYQRTSV